MNKVKVKKLDKNAIIPTYGTNFSAGADLYALCKDKIEIKPTETVMVHTGIAMEKPENYGSLVFARSGIATKRGLAPANKVGVIDSDYRGEIMVALHNHSTDIQFIENGERIAQMVIMPYFKDEFFECDELDDTARSSGGYGSTGTK
ncbi:MAG: dUTP diphosphatase [Clostridia bacterium]|nr:dUTP diphosphatase [Clostridia bacterium]